MNRLSEYRTSDLNLAGFLRARYNLKIKNLEPDVEDLTRALFVFVIDDDVDIEEAVAQYYNGNDSCSINSFMKELTDLRSWLRNFRANR